MLVDNIYKAGIKVTAESITESSSLNNKNKLKSLNKLKECSDIDDIINLLKEDETILESILPKLNEDNLSEDMEELKEYIINEGTGKSVLGILIGPRLWLMWRAAKAIISKANRKCGAFDVGDKRDVCIKKYKLSSYEEQIKVLKKMLKEVSSDKQKETINKKIDKLKTKIIKLNQKIAKKNPKDLD